MAKDIAVSSIFGDVVAELVAKGAGFRFSARGLSMSPAIEDGDLLQVEPADTAKLRRGDIIFYCADQQLKAHRIVLRGNSTFITRGDTGMRPDSEIRHDQIVGKIVAKQSISTGQFTRLDTLSARLTFWVSEFRRSLRTRMNRFGKLNLMFLLVVGVLLPSKALSQVAVDSASSSSFVFNGAGGSSSFTLAHTTGAASTVLVVAVSMNIAGNTPAAVTGVTYNGSAFTRLVAFDNGTNFHVEIWYLLSPTVGTFNTLTTISKTGSNPLGLEIGAITFSGTGTTSPFATPVTATGSSTDPTVTVPSAAGDLVLDVLATAGKASISAFGTGQTSRWSGNTGASGQDVTASGSTQAGAASVKMQETLNQTSAWTLVGVSIQQPVDVSITKTASASTVLQNQNFTYTLTVSNSGPGNSPGTTVTDTLPSQVTFVSATPSQGTCSQASGTVTCNLGNIDKNNSATIAIVVTAATPSQATNTATVSTIPPDSNSANNSASVTVTIEFPNAVRLNSLIAVQTNEGVQFSWRTGGELHNLGFNVYRDMNGEKTKLNPALIAGSALLMRDSVEQHAAKTYSWIDKATQGGATYWLEDVDLNGIRTMHGPVSVSPVATASLNASVSQRALVKPHLSTTSMLVPSHGVQQIKEVVATPYYSAASRDTGLKLAAHPAVKILVDHEGWYRIRHAQLVSAGLPRNVNVASLRLYAEGVEQPIRLTHAEHVFEAGSAVEFYGTAIDTPYSGQRVYWLTWEGGSQGARIGTSVSSGSAGPEAQTFTQTIELKPRTTYFAALLREDTDNFFGPLVSPTTESQSFNVSNLAAGPGIVDISLQGVTQGQPHDVTVMMNGATLGEVKFNDQQLGRAQFTVPTGVLANGVNTISLTSQLGSSDISLIDRIDVSFPHTFTAENDQLRFTADAGAMVRVDGFRQRPSRLIDITDPLHPSEVEYMASSASDGFTLQATVPWTGAATHRLLALSDDAMATAGAILNHAPTRLHGVQDGADIIILTVPQFSDSLQPLVSLHRSRKESVALVRVEDVYDEFNFGEPSPYAIRRFLQTTTERWKTSPHFLLLAGDASVDPRDYLGFGFFDLVPTKIIPTAELKTASDDWFSDFDSSGTAKIATGRLPARTVAEMQTMVGKTTAYVAAASSQWNREALLVADVDDPGVSFTQASKSVQRLLPATVSPTNVFAHALDTQTARASVIDALSLGKLLVNYNGHGSVEMWSGSDLFDDTAASSLTNGEKLPLFVIMNCLNGFFHDVYTQSLAEALMLSPQGGAVAVWASSGLTQPDPQFQMNRTLTRALFSGEDLTVGDAIRAAKASVSDQDVKRTFILFGDPALRLKH